MQEQQAKLDWHDKGVPVSRQFDDPYFSLENGLEETRHVFLGGNGLPERFKDGFHVAELGFGTGLNLLAVWQEWQESGQEGKLHFTSFEAFPMGADDMERGLALFPVDREKAALLVEVIRQGSTRIVADDLEANIVLGDARETLSNWEDQADAWFLDGFAPAKNPELWEEPLLQDVYNHTAPDGTAATYTAAGEIRRRLDRVGFEVERIPGFGRKRHMTVARKAGTR